MIKLLKFTILLFPEKEQILSLGNIILEPIIFNIGFTQIKAFIKFIPILFDFLAGSKKEYDNNIKELKDFEIIEQDNLSEWVMDYDKNTLLNSNQNKTKKEYFLNICDDY